MDKRYLVGVKVQATSEAVQFLANVGKPYPGLIYFPIAFAHGSATVYLFNVQSSYIIRPM